MDTNCTVTVMMVWMKCVGFIRRAASDSYPEMLVAPGGKVEITDGTNVCGVPFWPIEHAAMREIKEETGVVLKMEQLSYFTSLILPSGRIIISMCASISDSQRIRARDVIFLSKDEITERHAEFAPGMLAESLALLEEMEGR